MNRLVLASALTLVSTAAFAQSANITANATASILKPITIAKATDMAFGEAIWDGATAGTVVMPVTTAGHGAITQTGGISATFGTQTAASFTITGKKNNAYTIAVQAVGGGTVTLDAASDATKKLTVTGLTINSANGVVGSVSHLDSSRNDTVYVGGTLNVPTTAIEDDYTTASGAGAVALQVTVTYN